MNEKRKNYLQRNKEKISLQKKANYNKNKEIFQARAAEYYQSNKEKILLRRNKDHKQLPGRYKHLKSSARRRGIDLLITFEQYKLIISNNVCHYCKNQLNESGSGLDRKNNERYYKENNVVPCCKRCNVTFMDNYNYEEKMLLAQTIQKIDERRNENSKIYFSATSCTES